MDSQDAKRLIEGWLFVSGQPVPFQRLKEVCRDLPGMTVQALVEQLNQDYQQHDHAFRIQAVAGGYQLVTDPRLAPALKRTLQWPRQDTFSKSAMETLAIVAYRQPLTKAEIEAIRGVDGSATLETLLERRFIRVVGRKDSPGRPLLYGTTDEFLRHMGLKSLKELPPLSVESRQVPGLEHEPLPLVPPMQAEESQPPPEAPADSEQASEDPTPARTNS